MPGPIEDSPITTDEELFGAAVTPPAESPKPVESPEVVAEGNAEVSEPVVEPIGEVQPEAPVLSLEDQLAAYKAQAEAEKAEREKAEQRNRELQSFADKRQAEKDALYRAELERIQAEQSQQAKLQRINERVTPLFGGIPTLMTQQEYDARVARGEDETDLKNEASERRSDVRAYTREAKKVEAELENERHQAAYYQTLNEAKAIPVVASGIVKAESVERAGQNASMGKYTHAQTLAALAFCYEQKGFDNVIAGTKASVESKAAQAARTIPATVRATGPAGAKPKPQGSPTPQPGQYRRLGNTTFFEGAPITSMEDLLKD